MSAVLVVGAAGADAAAPQVSCAACILVDDTGRVLFARRPDDRRANASTTKMITALVVSRGTTPSEEVVVSSTAAAVGGGGLDLEAGDRLSVDELLQALLLTSSNDAATALAEHVAGSTGRFVSAMNRLARRLGAARTHFVNPHGLDAHGHFSTARDLAVIAARLLADRQLAAIVATPTTTIDGPRGPERLENRNPLLKTYRGAIGVKTGYTAASGNVLVAAARRYGRRLIAVAMDSTNAALDDRRLFGWGWTRLRRTILLPRGARVSEIVLDPGGAAVAATSGAVRGIERPDTVESEYLPPDHLALPLPEGAEVGQVVVRSRGRILDVVPAVSVRPLEEAGASWLTTAVMEILQAGYALASAAEATRG